MRYLPRAQFLFWQLGSLYLTGPCYVRYLHAMEIRTSTAGHSKQHIARNPIASACNVRRCRSAVGQTTICRLLGSIRSSVHLEDILA
ncbi:hypothetical protein GGS23DRAFT_578081 [Durotheca rogersii]|uniref:uncharacterized protein n=1 Tax=Durotheca rogersii TaxID=419775 RepID=UPI002220553B|nr:uncharacterized protein GGS23DRAFT_578081 [Durotheca rogersii]KAI5860948.1 hypothetical protein GGS23DRAFT_578081 [Durotheca rogersii]